MAMTSSSTHHPCSRAVNLVFVLTLAVAWVTARKWSLRVPVRSLATPLVTWLASLVSQGPSAQRSRASMPMLAAEWWMPLRGREQHVRSLNSWSCATMMVRVGAGYLQRYTFA